MLDLKESKISPTFNNPLPEDVDTIKFIKETMSAPITNNQELYFLIIDMVYRLVLKEYKIILNEINYGELAGYFATKIYSTTIHHFSYSKLKYVSNGPIVGDYPYQILLADEQTRS